MAQNCNEATAKPAKQRDRNTPTKRRSFRWIAPPPSAALDAAGAAITSAYGKPSVVIEIGCGVGWHPIQYSRTYPEKTMLAFERTRSKFSRFEARLAGHAPAPNLIPINGDAIRLLPPHLANLNIETVFILYPNPEPKAKAQRWIQMPFLDLLRDALVPDGRLVFATNINSYAEEILQMAPTRGWLVAGDSRINIHDGCSFHPRTHFERKYYDRGETLRHIELKKKGENEPHYR